jgi:hypothetical protein
MRLTEHDYKVLLRDAMKNLGRLAADSVSLNTSDLSEITRFADVCIETVEKIETIQLRRNFEGARRAGD